MTQNLTPNQAATLALLGEDGVEPLYYARFDTGVVGGFVVTGPSAGDDFSVAGNVTVGGTITFDAIHAPASNQAGIGETNEETAANMADAINQSTSIDAWSQGNRVYVRADDPNDTTLVQSGSAVGSGLTVIAEVSQGSYEFVSAAVPPRVIGGTVQSFPASLVDVDPVGQEKDRASNVVTKATIEVTLQWDDYTEEMITRAVIVGRTVTLRRGVAGVDVADWVPDGVFVVLNGPFPQELGHLSADRSNASEFLIDERPPIRFELADRAQWLLEVSGTAELSSDFYQWETQPTLQALRDLLRLQIMGDINTAVPFVDETSFLPSGSDWSSVSHFNVAHTRERTRVSETAAKRTASGRLNGNVEPYWSEENRDDLRQQERWERQTVGDTVSTEDYFNAILLLLPGQVTADEDGQLRARFIDRTTIAAGTATIRNWDESFVPSGGLSDNQRDFYSRLIVEVGSTLEGKDADGENVGLAQKFSINDRSSGRAHRVRSANAIRADETLSSRFLASIGRLKYALPENILSDGSDSIFVPSGGNGFSDFRSVLTAASTHVCVETGIRGFAGSYFIPRSEIYMATNWSVSGGTVVWGDAQPSYAALSASRRAYFRLQSPANQFAIDSESITGVRSAATEIIELNGSRVPTELGLADTISPIYEQQPTFRDVLWQLKNIEYTVSGRNMFGTTGPAVWLPGTRIVDVTVARWLALDRLDQFNWGYPELEGTTPLDQLDIQIGDFVSVALPHLIGFRGVGSTQLGLVFEILSKTVHRDRIDWRLGLAARTTPYVAVPVYPQPPEETLVPNPPVTFSPGYKQSPALGQALSIGSATGRPDVFVAITASTSATGTIETPPSLSLADPGEPDPYLLLFVASNDAGGDVSADSFSAITYGGVSMTLLSRSYAQGATPDVFHEVWGLDSTGLAAASSSNFSFTAGSGSSVAVNARAVFLKYVDTVTHSTSFDAAPGELNMVSPIVPGSMHMLSVVESSAGSATQIDGGSSAAIGGGPSLAYSDSFDSATATHEIIIESMPPYTTSIDVAYAGSADLAGDDVYIESIAEIAFKQMGFLHGWDFSDAPTGIAGNVPAFWGALPLTLNSGTYATGFSTTGVSRGAIGSGRTDSAITPSSAFFDAQGGDLRCPPSNTAHVRALVYYDGVGGRIVYWVGAANRHGIDLVGNAAGLIVQYWNQAAGTVVVSLSTSFGGAPGWKAIDVTASQLNENGTGIQVNVFVNGVQSHAFTSETVVYEGCNDRVFVANQEGANFSAVSLMMVGLRHRPFVSGPIIGLSEHQSFAQSAGLYTP